MKHVIFDLLSSEQQQQSSPSSALDRLRRALGKCSKTVEMVEDLAPRKTLPLLLDIFVNSLYYYYIVYQIASIRQVGYYPIHAHGWGEEDQGGRPRGRTPSPRIRDLCSKILKKLANLGKYILPWYVQILQCTHLCNLTLQHIRIGGGS